MALLVVLWIGVAFLYHRGAAGVGFGPGGGALSFDREHAFTLFEVDRHRHTALLVSHDGSMAVVAYGRGMFPFCPLCGTYEPRGSIVNLARYYKDGWIYTDHLGGPFAELYHVPTGEKVDVERPAGGGEPDAGSLPPYAERGLTLDPAHAITPALIEARFTALPTIDESCVVFNAAFLLLAGTWLVVGLLLLIRRRWIRTSRT